MATDNLDSADLKAVLRGGLIREDVMDRIFDISRIPLPFTDMIGSGSHKNSYAEWTTDELAAPDVANATVDGDDVTGQNDTKTGARVGNHSQISDKVVRVSFRADASDTIGRARELGYQLARRQQELRRDVEAIALENQGSIADDGNTIAGNAGGLPTWITNDGTYDRVKNGTPGGFNTGTGLTDALTPSAATAITEKDVRDVVEAIYQEGGDPTKLMSVPKVIRLISEYLFTSSARVATLMADQGKSAEAATAMGAVNVFVTDFGTLDLVPNRLQQLQGGGTWAFAFICDPEYLSMSYLQGYRTEMLAKTGHAENRLMAVDWTLKVHTEKAHGIISSVDVSAPMVPGT